MHECEILQERITRLSSGVSVIKVGAATEVEMIEKKHRIEDAIEAVKSAQLEGIVPGGGVALLRASAKCGLDEELPHAQRIGFEIVRAAIQEPIRQIAQNCGLSPDIIVREVLELDDSQGYDFSADECGVDLYEKGIIDPVKVTRCALQNAASVAGTLITTGHAIVSREA